MTIKGVKDILNPLQGFRKRFIAPIRNGLLNTKANLHATASIIALKWTELDGDGKVYNRGDYDPYDGDSFTYDINYNCDYDVVGSLYINTLNAQFVTIDIEDPDAMTTIYYEDWIR